MVEKIEFTVQRLFDMYDEAMNPMGEAQPPDLISQLEARAGVLRQPVLPQPMLGNNGGNPVQ